MKKPQFRRLGKLYFIALGCIALSIVVSQLLIQTSIQSQQDDARVINVAGRQRMLSQKISKLALKIKQEPRSVMADRAELNDALELWKQSHDGLLNRDPSLGLSGENSEEIVLMFREIEQPFDKMFHNAHLLLADTTSKETKEKACDDILQHEATFLKGMNEIVFRYDLEAREKVSALKKQEYTLFFISLIIIVFELAFVFRPIANNVQNTVQDLLRSEESSKKMAAEITELYEELGRSYQDLEAVNFEPESPSVYAKMNLRGEFSYISPTFIQVMEYEDQKPGTLPQLLDSSGYRKEIIDGLMELVREKRNWMGELKLINEAGDFCWLETFLVPVNPANEIKMIARDLTEFKEARMRSREINRERIEQSIKEHQYRSSLILQGQEEERKRISRELHDGVGQMMSALKLLIESIAPSSKIMKNRVKNAKDLTKSMIREIRRVSFNLTPSNLEDFGLVAAVRKFCEEIDQVTKSQIIFLNETRFINRLDSAIETNLYRIIQEAVNNAIKYARADKIQVIFQHDQRVLKILIEDDGQGFDLAGMEKYGHFEKAGHGIFNMKERTAYIGGDFQIITAPKEGTKIFIELALSNHDKSSTGR